MDGVTQDIAVQHGIAEDSHAQFAETRQQALEPWDTAGEFGGHSGRRRRFIRRRWWLLPPASREYRRAQGKGACRIHTSRRSCRQAGKPVSCKPDRQEYQAGLSKSSLRSPLGQENFTKGRAE